MGRCEVEMEERKKEGIGSGGKCGNCMDGGSVLLYDGYGDVLGMGRRERDMRLICELD